MRRNPIDYLRQATCRKRRGLRFRCGRGLIACVIGRQSWLGLILVLVTC